MTDTPDPEPRYGRFRITYPSGTVIEAHYADGASLKEVRATHPLAVVEAVGDRDPITSVGTGLAYTVLSNV